jgi:hypothetical protein
MLKPSVPSKDEQKLIESIIRAERAEACLFEWLGYCERNETYALRFTQSGKRWCVDISEQTIERCSEAGVTHRDLVHQIQIALANRTDCGRATRHRP